MATTPNKFSLFFLLFTLLPQLHARESQFFSKFNPKETQLLPTSVQPQQEPNFIPQTKDSAGYGLYGHLSPSTTTNDAAYDNLPTTVPENHNKPAYTTPIHSKDSYVTTDPQYGNKNQYNGDSSMYNNQKQDQFYGHLPPLARTPAATYGGADDNLPTTLPENYNTVAYTTPILSKDSYVATDPLYGNKNQYNGDSSMYNNQYTYNSRKQGMGAYGGSTYNSREQGMSETRFMDRGDTAADGRNMYNTETQGMSDTRFMENGKYYYDVDSESSNAYGDANSRRIDSRNGYHSRGYYGNKDNSYNMYNSNARFQENQKDVFTP